MQAERKHKFQRANVKKKLAFSILSKAICSIGDIYRWEKFIFGVAMAQRSESRVELVQSLPSKQAILKHSFIVA